MPTRHCERCNLPTFTRRYRCIICNRLICSTCSERIDEPRRVWCRTRDNFGNPTRDSPCTSPPSTPPGTSQAASTPSHPHAAPPGTSSKTTTANHPPPRTTASAAAFESVSPSAQGGELPPADSTSPGDTMPSPKRKRPPTEEGDDDPCECGKPRRSHRKVWSWLSRSSYRTG